MKLQQIRYVLVLAEEGSFNRAAKRCGVSQPSLSKAVRAFELSLGGELFNRRRTGVSLTAFGAAILPYLVRLQLAEHQVLEMARVRNRV